MSSFKITGGKSLHGEVIPQGAKNEALQIISATLLTAEKVCIDNIPDILDVRNLIKLLGSMGVKVEKINDNKYNFQADDIDLEYISSADFLTNASKLRGSVMTMGPLLARFGQCYLSKPGGDKIGRRRLDTHFIGFMKLGAEMQRIDDLTMRFKTNQLQGAYIHLDEASVTGTANVIMAAVLAKGKTTIFNAACEPYLKQLSKMLARMGAIIEGIGSNLLTITGVESLHGCDHRMLADMIEVGSFIGLAAMTKSEITIKNVDFDELGIIPSTFEKLGIKLIRQGEDLFIPKQDHYAIESFIDGSILTIADAPWPGFTPDLISIVLVTAIQAKGSVLVHQKMFESRLFFVDKLIEMGAQIILCDPHRATVIGHDHSHQLRGIKMSSPDIRAGVALLIAALSANGESIISNIDQIDRGYQNIDTRLQALGAQIERIA